MKKHNKSFLMVFCLIIFISLFSFNGVVSALPDLVPMSVSASSYSVEPGDSITVSWKVKNIGTSSSSSFYNKVSLATSSYGTSPFSLGYFSMSSISAGSTSSDSRSVQIPTTATRGNCYYLTAYADAYESITESNDNNNIEKAPNQVCIISTVVPSVETRSATSVSGTSAVLNARITNDGGASILERRFSWGTTYLASDGYTNSVGVSGNDFYYSLAGLQSGTTYYFQSWAKNSVGWGQGNAVSFTTPSQQSCTNECSSGQTQCNGNSYQQTCGNYDGDSCLEFGGNNYCTYGCSGGSCNSAPQNIACYSNSNCGTNEFISGTETCSGNDVWAQYKTYNCINSGTTSSYCSYSLSSQPWLSCAYGCSGGNCNQPPQTPSCTDGIKNQDETSIDCGGSVCGKCINEKTCNSNNDCQSGYCENGVCKDAPVNNDVSWLAKAIMSEASIGTQEEKIAVGWTALNRLNSGNFGSNMESVIKNGFAYNQEPTQQIINLADELIKRKYPDSTNGALYFLSPISMPHEGEEYKCKSPIGNGNYDCKGGLHQIPGTSNKAYFASWAKPKTGWIVTSFYETTSNLEWISNLNNVRNWYYMFYRPISGKSKFLTLPFNDKDVVITSGWNESRGSGTNVHNHGAIDYDRSADVETFDVLAAAPGIVEKIGYDDESGNYIKIRHDEYLAPNKKPYYTLYMHLANDSIKGFINVKENQNVNRGEKIAMASNTGMKSKSIKDVHLHFEVRDNPYVSSKKDKIDPYDLYGKKSAYGSGVGSNAGPNYLWTTMPPSFPPQQTPITSLKDTIEQDGRTEWRIMIDTCTNDGWFTKSCGKTIWDLIWPGSDLGLRLFSPTGAVIDENTASTNPDVEFISSPTEKKYIINNSEPGEWTVEITGLNVSPEYRGGGGGGGGGEPYTLKVSTISTLIAEVSTDKDEYNQSEPIKIFASVSDAGAIIKGVNIKAEIEKPDNTIVSLDLLDNGEGTDSNSDDGIYSNSFQDNLTGIYNIKIIVNGSTDASGQFTREATKSIKIIDTTPPEIIINSPKEKNYSYKESFEINFSVEDADSGINLSSALLDNSNVNNNDLIDLFVFDLGEHEFKINAKDNAGNTNEKIILFNVIDDVAPETTNNYDGNWKTQDFNITLISIDEKSNVKEIHFKLNNNLEQTIFGDTAQVLINYEDDNNVLEYWAIDEYNNEEEHKILNGIKLDKTSPQSNDNFIDEWKTQNFYIELTASDIVIEGNPSGLNEIYYELFFDEQNQGIKKVSQDGMPLINYEDDNSKLEYWSEDNAGNKEDKNIIKRIKLDKTSPEILLELNPQKDFYLNDELLPVEYNISDPVVQGDVSGVNEIKWFVDDVETATPFDINDLLGTHILKLIANDVAGNQNNKYLEFEVALHLNDLFVTPEVLNINPGVIMVHTEFPEKYNESIILNGTLDGAPMDKVADKNIKFRRIDVENYLNSIREVLDTHFEVLGNFEFKGSKFIFYGDDEIKEVQR